MGVFGAVDMHFEYTDATPLANGTLRTVNFNFFEGTTLSDTLSITITGQAPAGSAPNNTVVDLHWRSDTADEIVPPALSNAHNLSEVPWATGDPAFDLSPFIRADTGLSGAHVLVRSVPEPSSLVLTGLGAVGLGGLAPWRRRRG